VDGKARLAEFALERPLDGLSALLGKGPRPYFELETPGAAQAPKVDFSK